MNELFGRLKKLLFRLSDYLAQRNHELQKKDVNINSPIDEGKKIKKEREFGLGNFLLDDPTDKEVQNTIELMQEVKTLLIEEGAKKAKEKKQRKKYQKRQLLQTTGRRVEELEAYLSTFSNKPRTDMICMVMYDIENNKVRKRIADYLQAKGLQRIQYSVFLGQVDRRIFKQIVLLF